MKNNKKKIDTKEYTFQIKRKYVILVLISTFFINFDSAFVIPIIANYAVSLGASIAFSGVIVGIYSICHIPSNIFLGRLIDKFGRKGFLIFGIFLDGISIFMYYLAGNPAFLLLARIIHGLGGGFGGPATMSYLGDSFPKEKSGKGMAFYGISVGFSMLLGFMAGGLLASSIGYKNLFLTVSIIMFIISVFCISLPASYTPEKQKLKFTKEVKIFYHLISNKKLFPAQTSILILFFNLGILTASYTIYLKLFEYSDSQIGMILGIMVILSILTNYPAGKLSDKIGKLPVLIIGQFFTGIAFLILTISPFSPYPYIGMIIFGIGHGCIFPTSAGTVRDETSRENRGIATGLFYALTVVGIAIGSPISGLIVELANFQAALLVGILLPFFFCLIFFLLMKLGRKDLEKE